MNNAKDQFGEVAALLASYLIQTCQNTHAMHGVYGGDLYTKLRNDLASIGRHDPELSRAFLSVATLLRRCAVILPSEAERI